MSLSNNGWHVFNNSPTLHPEHIQKGMEDDWQPKLKFDNDFIKDRHHEASFKTNDAPCVLGMMKCCFASRAPRELQIVHYRRRNKTSKDVADLPRHLCEDGSVVSRNYA